MTPEQLAFPEGCFKGLPRPNGSHAGVMGLVADDLMPNVMGWFQGEEDETEVREQIMEVLDDFHDGYEMAKELEDRYGWDADSELVDVLDGASFYGPRKKAVMAWIRDNAITPKLSIGQVVKAKQGKYSKEINEGEIVKIDEGGIYIVMIPALGHVREGIGTHGCCLAWEDVEALNPAA